MTAIWPLGHGVTDMTVDEFRHTSSWHLMECGVRSSYLVMQPWKAFSGLQVSRAPVSTVVSSHSSPTDLAENHPLGSRAGP